jgi:Domain of unknown function (DUF4148)
LIPQRFDHLDGTRECECEWNGLRILRGSIGASGFDIACKVRDKTLDGPHNDTVNRTPRQKNSAEELALNERGIVGNGLACAACLNRLPSSRSRTFSFPTPLIRSRYAMTPKPWRAFLFRSTDTFFTRALRVFDLIAVIRNRSTTRPVMHVPPLDLMESKMKTVALFALSAALLVSSGAFAQGLTRAEVREQLIAAEQNGSRLVTDASYPDVSPSYQNQASHRDPAATAYGGVSAGSSASASAPRMTPGQCVGPVSFCSIYSGS